MSRAALPDLLGLRQFTDNGGSPLLPHRRVLDLRGEVTIADNPQGDRLEMVVGPLATLRVTIGSNQPAFNPPNFATASLVMVTSTLSGARITPVAADCITLRRVWINVGSVPIEIIDGYGSTRLLLPNRSTITALHTEAGKWVLPPPEAEEE